MLINVARGEVVDQSALVTAVQSKHIAGAVLDVYRDEFVSPYYVAFPRVAYS